VAALVTTLVGFFFFIKPHMQSSPSADATHDLLECLVCGQPVDPEKTPYKLNLKNGQTVYFDRQECMDAFVAEPTKYGHVRFKVSANPISPGTDTSAAPVPQATPAADGASDAPTDAVPPPDSATPPTEETAPPACAPPAAGDSGDRDPNPPPLHAEPSDAPSSTNGCAPQHPKKGTSGCSNDVPQPPADCGSAPAPAASGSEDVPQPPACQ
jgi:YHS domain-containing protein